MSNLVFQYYLQFSNKGKFNPHYETPSMPLWAQKSTEMMEKYAKKHNASYICGTDKTVEADSAYFEVCRVFLDPAFDSYDKVLYCDVDVIPHNMNANIFEVKFEDVAGWSEWKDPALKVPINWSASQVRARYSHFGAPIIGSSKSDLRMINTGVVLWSRDARLKARETFVDHNEWFRFKNAALDSSVKGWGHSSHCLDQPYLNAMWSKHGFKVTEIDKAWNWFAPNADSPCNFGHYVQNSREVIPERFKDA